MFGMLLMSREAKERQRSECSVYVHQLKAKLPTWSSFVAHENWQHIRAGILPCNDGSQLVGIFCDS